jgi:hypothetical protein
LWSCDHCDKFVCWECDAISVCAICNDVTCHDCQRCDKKGVAHLSCHECGDDLCHDCISMAGIDFSHLLVLQPKV